MSFKAEAAQRPPYGPAHTSVMAGSGLSRVEYRNGRVSVPTGAFRTAE